VVYWDGGLLEWVYIDEIDGLVNLDYFGFSVALDYTGDTLAVGAKWADGVNGLNSGQVRVFEYTSGYTPLGAVIDGEASADNFGFSVSLSSNGRTVAIGANTNAGGGTDRGHARVYDYSGGWFQRGGAGVDIDGEGDNDESGIAVSLSSDGNTVAIGAHANDGVNGADSGHVRVYEWTGGPNWNQKGADIDGEATDDESGYSLSLSSDGNTVAIGAQANDGVNGGNSGHVRVYDYCSVCNVWNLRGGLAQGEIDGEASGDNFGFSVSLTGDGNTVVVGAPGNDAGGSRSGQARVYTWSGSAWVRIGFDIDGEAVGDETGTSVAISDDGNIIVVGARYYDGIGQLDTDNYGYARIFKFQ